MKRPQQLLLLAALVLSGCVNTDAVMLDPSRSYPPTEYVVILSGAPERDYDEIAIIEGNGSIFNNESSVIKKVQKKAAKIGAHAIFLITSNSQYVPPTYTTNVDGSLLTIPGGDKITVKAIAIRYR